jgi:2-hydroxy-3-keto-5-methylthiopentenyl-1-phosphate phosphatase
MSPTLPTASRHSPARRRLLALLDYDGTLTTRDSNEVVLQRFTGDAWRVFEEAALRGEIGHAECLDLQIGLLRVPRAAFFDAVVDAAEVAPGVPELLAGVVAGGGRGVVVSAGFREAIEAVWRRDRLPAADVLASELIGDGDGGGPPYRVTFSAAFGDCPSCGPGCCKGAVVGALREVGEAVAVFGDGLSDLCPARLADVVFAKGTLARLCAAEGIAYHALDDFGRAWRELDAWLIAHPST